MSNPYRTLPDHCFWARAMTLPAPGAVDPVTKDLSIGRTAKIATMGSCFAQHLARHISKLGLNYYVTENAPANLSPDEAASRNYGVFSARYGNIYTVRQALQLFYRAFGVFRPQDDVWTKESGYVDAFRPAVEPTPYATIDQVRESAKAHLVNVREIFLSSDWIVFTLGLTEAWVSRLDGAVYPLAPEVSAGTFDPARYGFVNFTIDQVRADLLELIARIHGVNPNCHILLTVSPVPLIATYEQRHVWVSTTYSKGVLRVAADEAERAFDFVHYFPSYEVITSPSANGSYYDDDLRQVTDLGVNHVMKLFTKHFVQTVGVSEVANRDAIGPNVPAAPAVVPVGREGGVSSRVPSPDGVVCDEEVIERALRDSGFSRAS